MILGSSCGALSSRPRPERAAGVRVFLRKKVSKKKFSPAALFRRGEDPPHPPRSGGNSGGAPRFFATNPLALSISTYASGSGGSDARGSTRAAVKTLRVFYYAFIFRGRSLPVWSHFGCVCVLNLVRRFDARTKFSTLRTKFSTAEG